MNKTRMIVGAVAMLALAGSVRADDVPPASAPATPIVESSSAPKAHYQGLLHATTTSSAPCAGQSCQTGSCAPAVTAAPCATCSDGKCSMGSIWKFFTYRRLPYTDINTFCPGCSEEPRPPLYAYFIHPCADKRAPYTLPDLSKPEGCAVCAKCGKQMQPGCSTCQSCGR